VAEDVRRPLCIVVDRPTALTQLAAAEGRPDPQALLDVPLRHGRTAGVAVAVADQLDVTETLAPVVIAQTRARVVLGALAPEHVAAVLGAPQRTTPAAEVPPGRGYARLGTGPVLRLQVPATPDPYDEETPAAEREAVLALLPGTPPVSLVKHPGADGPAEAPEPLTGPAVPGPVALGPVALGHDAVLRPVADLELG
jgi:hypothetical protein